MFRPVLLASAVLFSGAFFVAQDADAGGFWRKQRWNNRATSTSYRSTTDTLGAYQRSLRSSNRVTYSGVSRAEQDYWRHVDAWYDHAYNGWRPQDFR